MQRTVLSLIAAAAFTATLASQDPIPPAGGFDVASTKDVLVNWSDRYRTRMDAHYPDPAKVRAPASGWPCVLVIHGKGGRRSNPNVVRRCTKLATLGYVALAYDVRGDGDTIALNPNQNSGDSSRRILDVAEAYFVAKNNLKTLLDESRLAITGWSMGAGFSLDAASFSGLTLPRAGFVSKMPKLSAAIPDINVLDRPEDYVPGGVMFQARAAQRIYDRNPNSPLVNALVAGQYTQLRAYFDRDPVQARTARLSKSDVPLLICYSQGDAFHFGNQITDLLPKLKAGVPRRISMKTGGHGTPGDSIEDAHEEVLVGRWCDRFLKGRRNNVDTEAVADFAIVPDSIAAWRDRTHPWKHRLFLEWPVKTPTTRYFLRSGTGLGRLSSSAPTQLEGPFTIAHRVQTGYGARDFLKDRSSPRVVNAKVPLVQVRFDLPAANVERELVGRSRLAFSVRTKIANLQLSASLFDVSPRGARRWITSGFAAKRGVAAGTHRFEMDFEDIPYVLPAGHRLQLTIHNMPARVNGTATHYLYVPEFVNEDYLVITGPQTPATLDLAFAARSGVSIIPRYAEASAQRPIDRSWQIEGEKSRASQVYVMLFGASGIAPAIQQPPLTLFLKPDAMTDLGLALLNTPIFPRSVGVLDANGRARPSFVVSLPDQRRALIGTRLEAVAVVLNGVDAVASAPASLVILP